MELILPIYCMYDIFDTFCVYIHVICQICAKSGSIALFECAACDSCAILLLHTQKAARERERAFNNGVVKYSGKINFEGKYIVLPSVTTFSRSLLYYI